MNELQARLAGDMRAALKAGDRPVVETLRLMIAALKDAQLCGQTDRMSLAQEEAVLQKMVKSARDAIEQATAVGRDDIVAHERAQLDVVLRYLPQQLTGAALLDKVREVAAEVGYTGPKDTGAFMKAWMSRYKGLADGRDVQAALGALG